MIELTHDKWTAIYSDIAQHHSPAVLLLRERMRNELGFTVRYGAYDQYPNRKIYLDFFDDSAETFFRMKYL